MTRKFKEESLVIASHNKNKIIEITSLLSDLDIHLLNAHELSLPIPDETESTYLGNALIKAKACALATNMPSLADDSGIELDAFNGEPGVHTAPYTQRLGGIENVFKLWQSDDRIKQNPKAAFICCQVLCWPDGHYEHFFAKVEGSIVLPPRGSNGHGYDPVFIPKGRDVTVAQMSFAEKNIVSHRALALKIMKEALFLSC